jgi:hypothetical protein
MKKVVLSTLFFFIVTTVAVIHAGEKVKISGWHYCPYCSKYLGPQKDYSTGQGLSGARGMMDSGIGPLKRESSYDYERSLMMIQQSRACQEFLDETVELRKELNDKRFMYHEAIRNPESTKEEITKLENDLEEIQNKISARRPLECIW